MEMHKIHLELRGHTLAPPDMMAAAKASLSPIGFDNLMEQTEGFPPTADELCKMVDAERMGRL